MARFRMIKVFLDSSVLVVACASKTGASAFILGWCRAGKLKGYISIETLKEAKKNVELKLNSIGKKRFAYYLKFANLVLVASPSLEKIAQCENYITQKDAPILAASFKSPASFLITLDKKHFFDVRLVKFAEPLEILAPGKFVQKHLKRRYFKGLRV